MTTNEGDLTGNFHFLVVAAAAAVVVCMGWVKGIF